MPAFESATSLLPRSMPPDSRVDDGTGAGIGTVEGIAAFDWDVPAGWEQGRGAWGGLVVGALVRAVDAAQGPQGRPIRTVSAHLVAPALAGPAAVTAALVRRGSSMSTWSAELVDADAAALAHAMVIAGDPRAPDLDEHLRAHQLAAMPAADPWQQCPVIPIQPPLGPAFAAHLQFRPITGLPLSQGPARILGWIGFCDDADWTAARLLGLVDAYWPAVYATLPAIRPVATVSFSAHLLVDPASLDRGEPLLFESQLAAATDGFTTETRRLWAADGRLAVENFQSIVVIR
ncbi:MAG: thioesterase family protein [Actinomycetales bacterium]|nr:thioesterase family protein [Actinomycetales bacterium]